MGDELGTVIAAYLQDAEAGRALSPDGGPYSPAALRRVRVALGHVDAAAGGLDPGALGAMDAGELEQLGRLAVDRAGLSPSRLPLMLQALHSLSAYAADGNGSAVRSGPAVRTGATAPSAAVARGGAVAEPDPRTPTYAMLALGAQLGTWTERIIVIAFVLTVIGLALELV